MGVHAVQCSQDATSYPELDRFAADEYIEQFVAGLPEFLKVRVASERVAPDRIVSTAIQE